MSTTRRLGRVAGAGALSTLLLLAACEQSSDTPTGLQPPEVGFSSADYVDAGKAWVCQFAPDGTVGEYTFSTDGGPGTTFSVTGSAYNDLGPDNSLDPDGASACEEVPLGGAVTGLTVTLLTPAIFYPDEGGPSLPNRWFRGPGDFGNFEGPTSSPAQTVDGTRGVVYWFKFNPTDEPGFEGCTPGYWKNHPDSWPPTGYATGQTVGSVFNAGEYGLNDDTLLDALSYGGGPGAVGGAKILLRAAVAGLLNASHPDTDYTMSAGALISAVNAALASGDRDTMLTLAASIDADNNLGCPLN